MSPRRTPIPDVPVFDDEPPMPYDDLDSRNQVDEATVDGQFTEEPVKEPAPVPEAAPIRALVTTAADHHLVVGMATLANMSEEEFERNLAVMERGQARIRTIMEKLLIKGEDYGHVPGIAKPFLQQPGAEKLANFYGFAVRQEAERIVRRVGDDDTIPPFAYHVKSFVHLGDTTGPIVAEGFGEANVYEDKYHYRNASAACPVCGKTGNIITRKTPPQLAGKRQCAAFGDKTGCGTVFEPNDPRLTPAGKEPTPDVDLFGLAETILQMAAKRSLVAAIRRATGTSGLFTQDSDSPSVQAQSAESGAGDPNPQEPVVEAAAPTETIGVGGRGTNATAIQHARLVAVAKEKGLKGKDIAELLERLFGLAGIERTGAAAMAAVNTLDADNLGNLLAFIETGDLSTVGAA